MVRGVREVICGKGERVILELSEAIGERVDIPVPIKAIDLGQFSVADNVFVDILLAAVPR